MDVDESAKIQDAVFLSLSLIIGLAHLWSTKGYLYVLYWQPETLKGYVSTARGNLTACVSTSVGLGIVAWLSTEPFTKSQPFDGMSRSALTRVVYVGFELASSVARLVGQRRRRDRRAWIGALVLLLLSAILAVFTILPLYSNVNSFAKSVEDQQEVAAAIVVVTMCALLIPPVLLVYQLLQFGPFEPAVARYVCFVVLYAFSAVATGLALAIDATMIPTTYRRTVQSMTGDDASDTYWGAAIVGLLGMSLCSAVAAAHSPAIPQPYEAVSTVSDATSRHGVVTSAAPDVWPVLFFW